MYLISKYRLELKYCDEVLFEECDQRQLSAESRARFLYGIFGNPDREILGSLYYDIHERAIGYSVAAVGTLTQALVSPRALFTPALLANAASMSLYHFHPSGDPAPSGADLRTTWRMTRCGELLGIPVLEHLILGHHGRFARVGS